MVTVFPAAPPLTLAVVISGRLTRAEYQASLLPPIQATIESGQEIRVLAVIDSFEGLEAGGLLNDLKAAAKLGGGQESRESYFAVVTDADWVRRAIAVFGWLVPAQIRVFTTSERAEA